jgi:hypothetical protein
VKLRLLFSLTILAHALAQASEPPGYYDSAKGKTEAELRAALHAIIRNHHVLPYSGTTHPNTADAIRALDEDPANTNMPKPYKNRNRALV